jgi:hypothetical protein
MGAREWTVFELNCLSAERALCRVFSIYMWMDHYIRHLLKTKYDWLDLYEINVCCLRQKPLYLYYFIGRLNNMNCM